MTSERARARPFPLPPARVVEILERLRLSSEQQNHTTQDLREVAALDKPWDPPACKPEIEQMVWDWLDRVVVWINEEHTWRTDRTIPECWARHPHIAHELATVACLRVLVGYSVTPQPLEEWHRHTLPAFLDRIVLRNGVDGCPPGRHQAWPGAVRARVPAQ